jgi:Ran GTPase-activating protein (RanGAP) involved in mRNA processing and transport
MNGTLQTLNLSGTFVFLLIFKDNLITDEGMKTLADALAGNRSIVMLNLGWNKFGSDGVNHLSDTLKKNQTLNTLHLNDNKLTDPTLESLSESLKKNTTLETVDLRGKKSNFLKNKSTK